MLVKVSKIKSEALDINSYELTAVDDSQLPAFTAGAHIDVEMADGLIRQYSLCNNPQERHRYCIGVLKDPASRGGSIAMHNDIREGSVVRISEPRNLFALTNNAERSILFAGGIGVTPILCMAEHLTYSNMNFEMHYCSRSKERMAFLKRINNSTYNDKVQLHTDDGPAEQKLNIHEILGNVESNTHIYVCGPTGFMDWVIDSARKFGWPKHQIHFEYFIAPINDSSENSEFEIEIASTGEIYQVPPDKKIIDVLSENNIDLPVSCAQGICGMCITQVLEGAPDHRDLFMSDEEHACNNKITPCCSRSLSKRLVLDL